MGVQAGFQNVLCLDFFNFSKNSRLTRRNGSSPDPNVAAN